MFTRGNFDHGRASATNGQPEYSETLNVTTFALMERRDGTTYIDAVVQRELQDTVNNEVIQKENGHALSGSHLHFASEYRECGIPDEEPYRNWLLLPREKASGQMFPIPPGAARSPCPMQLTRPKRRLHFNIPPLHFDIPHLYL